MPISIDGDDVSGITIDGEDVTEVTADGDVVWTAIPDSGVLRYRYESGSRITVVDSWNNSDGEINGGTFSTDSDEGTYALSNDGADDWVDAGGGLLNYDNGFSFATSIKTSTAAGQYLISEGNSSFAGAVLRLNSDGTISLVVNDGSSGQDVTSSTAVADGVYHHVGGGYHADTDTIDVVVDGTVENTADVSSLGSFDVSDVLAIGTESGGTDNGIRGQAYYNGLLDLTDIYSKGLTDTEWSNLNSSGSILG
jgi:hypothetical protein